MEQLAHYLRCFGGDSNRNYPCLVKYALYPADSTSKEHLYAILPRQWLHLIQPKDTLELLMNLSSECQSDIMPEEVVQNWVKRFPECPKQCRGVFVIPFARVVEWIKGAPDTVFRISRHPALVGSRLSERDVTHPAWRLACCWINSEVFSRELQNPSHPFLGLFWKEERVVMKRPVVQTPSKPVVVPKRRLNIQIVKPSCYFRYHPMAWGTKFEQ